MLNFFCGSCRRLKIFDREVEVRLDRKISGKPDMLFAGYLPVPGIASDRLIGLLGSEGRRFLNVGRVIAVEGGVEFELPYKSFSGKYGYVTLRGKSQVFSRAFLSMKMSVLLFAMNVVLSQGVRGRHGFCWNRNALMRQFLVPAWGF
ncbi:hypothetical protein [Burkholderia stagnalis]|uniref:hypothetical protein n=1 Tax=Burkholderia stagnalis TaxID=1503054 RepID=UPI000F807FC6|nr:hypothetical protein [Burkholderia stagnalis]